MTDKLVKAEVRSYIKEQMSHKEMLDWILSTGEKELYLATFGGGLNKLQSIDEDGDAAFKSYCVEDGLPSDILLSIREDNKGNLWMSTENGISKFIPEVKRRHFTLRGETLCMERVRASSFSNRTRSGKVRMFRRWYSPSC